MNGSIYYERLVNNKMSLTTTNTNSPVQPEQKPTFWMRYKVPIIIMSVVIACVLLVFATKSLWRPLFTTTKPSVYTGRFQPDPDLQAGADAMREMMKNMPRKV